MATPTPTKPDRFTGLPSGVSVGPLGRRLVAYLVDAVVPAVLLGVVLGTGSPGLQSLDVVALVLLGAWGLVVWWMFATSAAGPGMRLMKLQLVGFSDGRPIGWGRFLVRFLVLGLLSAIGVGLLVMLFFLLRHPRYQGWHDLAGNAVVIVARVLAPRAGRPSTTRAAGAAAEPAAVEAPSARPLTPPTQSPAFDPLAAAVPASALPMAPSGVEVGLAPVAPAAVAAGPSYAAPASLEEGEPVESDERTEPNRPTAQAAARWTAVLDDGREVPVTGLVLLGRNPQPRAGEETAELVKLADKTRTVSKSHLALNVDAESLLVADRGSTNGSTITTPDGVRTPCTPEQAVRVFEGSVVSMGDHWLTVRRD